MTVGVETENGSCDPDHTLLGWFVIRKLGYNIDYLCIKCVDSIVSCSSDIIRCPEI